MANLGKQSATGVNQPVHPNAAFERTLQRPPWPCTPLHYAALLGSMGRGVFSFKDGGSRHGGRRLP